MSNPDSLSPERIHTLLQSAFDHHQDGRLDEAKKIYNDLLEILGDFPPLHYNLGLIHFSQHQPDQACRCFARALETNPADVDSLFNLALSLKASGKMDEAIETYLQLLAHEPKHLDALYNLAGCYREQRIDQQAIACYQKVVALDPCHQSATNNLAYMYQLAGEVSRAIECYRRLLEISPEHEAARHMLAALSGESPQAPPEAYVRSLFDSYSHRYEKSLVEELKYNVPLQLRTMFDSLENGPSRFQNGIDLGCGTGLSGDAFKDLVENFDGVDLAAKMIDVAREKDIYRRLFTGNITSFLKDTSTVYDFALAADVLNYLGDLGETFRLLNRCIRPGTIFCFSTETSSHQGYALQRSGRYAHEPAYIQQLATDFGWCIMLQHSADLRREADGWIAGNLWILQRL